MKEYMTREEALEYFDVSFNTLKKWREMGLPVIKVSGKTYYRKGAFDEFLSAYETQEEYVRR